LVPGALQDAKLVADIAAQDAVLVAETPLGAKLAATEL